jgi:hypothetical protein
LIATIQASKSITYDAGKNKICQLIHNVTGLQKFPINVQGEPVFSVMAAGWFCEKSGWIGKVEDVKPVLSFFFKKNGFQPATILRRRIFTWMNCEIDEFHPVLIHLGMDIIWF